MAEFGIKEVEGEGEISLGCLLQCHAVICRHFDSQ